MMIDGEPWFVGRDVAQALGYKKPTDAVNTNVDEGDSARKGVRFCLHYRKIWTRL